MIGTIPFRPLPSPAVLRTKLPGTGVVCASQRGSSSIPKMEPFSRSKMERVMKEPSFIQKSENDLTEYCCVLDGDESYSCWRAYFELKDLEKESPKEDVEKLVRQAGGIKNLIQCLHGITALQKRHDSKMEQKASPLEAEKQVERPCPIPDGLPKTKEEIEEEEQARMPDSPYTRMLRSKGRHPAWYSEIPDHETD